MKRSAFGMLPAFVCLVLLSVAGSRAVTAAAHPALSAHRVAGRSFGAPTVSAAFHHDVVTLPCPAAGAGPVRAGRTTAPPPIVSFDGLNMAQANPYSTTVSFATDTNGAVGPNDYMQVVNFALAVYSKTGTLLCGPVLTASFWSGFAGCDGIWSDAIVLYDKLADRWFISRFAGSSTPSAGSWNQCIAVSRTGDPLGSYDRYGFTISTAHFNDYPKFGIWPDAYYMTSNADKIFSHTGVFVTAFDRNAILAGAAAPAMVQFFVPSVNNEQFQMLPADLDGNIAPPAGSPDYIAEDEDSNLGFPTPGQLVIDAFHVDWTAPANSTLTTAATLTPQAFNSNLCNEYGGGSQFCIPQPGTTNKLDSLAYGYLMYRLVYRNFGDHETLLLNQTIEAPNTTNQAAIRWYELRQTTAQAWSIYQQGTYAPDTNDRWLGSIAMDAAGDIALGFDVSSSSVYPSIHYAGRLPSDPLGTLPQTEQSLQDGSGSLTGSNFFGDYSRMAIDPVDDCTFWYTSAYFPANTSTNNWSTHIGSFRFPNCSTACQGVTLSALPPNTAAVYAPVTFTASAPGCASPKYEYWLLPPGSSTWQALSGGPGEACVQLSGATQTSVYTTLSDPVWDSGHNPCNHDQSFPAGSYTIALWARDAASGNPYDTYAVISSYTLTPVCTGATLSASPPSPHGLPAAVTFTAAATPTSGATCQYEFWGLPIGSNWVVAQGYSTASSFQWSVPSGTLQGVYQIAVWVEAQGSASPSGYDSFAIVPYTLGCAVALTAQPPGPANGQNVTFTATTSGVCSQNLQYQWWGMPPGGSWGLGVDYPGAPTLTVASAGVTAGQWNVAVLMRAAGSTAPYDAYAIIPYTFNTAAGAARGATRAAGRPAPPPGGSGPRPAPGSGFPRVLAGGSH